MMLNNNIIIPAIGYGTFPMKEELIENIRIACDNGYELIDTSEDYYNMEYIGEGLKAVHNKDGIFIISKISWPSEIFNMRSTIERYIMELQIERPIDCILVHFPSPFTYIDMWKELEKIYALGLCRSIGVCNFEVRHLKRLIRNAKILPMINQLEIHPTFQQRSIVQFCKDHDIQIMCYSPLARMDETLVKNDVLLSIAQKHNVTVPQVILRWDIQKGYIPLPSAKNENHIKSNINVFNFQLSQDDMNRIDDLECNNRVRYSVKTFYNNKQRLSYLKCHLKYVIKKLLCMLSD